jgi:hypothetical protein
MKLVGTKLVHRRQNFIEKLKDAGTQPHDERSNPISVVTFISWLCRNTRRITQNYDLC